MRVQRWLVWTCLGMVLGGSLGWAEKSPRGFSIRQILRSPFPSDLTAAPRGDRIAWVFNAEGVRNIWVAEGPDFRARRLTPYDRDDGQDLSDLRFTPDGDAIVYVRGGPKNAAGEYPNPTSDPAGTRQEVWVTAWTGGPPRRLGEGSSPEVSPTGDLVAFLHDGRVWVAPVSGNVEARPMFAVRGRVTALEWSPDGKRLAFVTRRGDYSFIGIYDLPTNTIRYVAPSVDRDHTPRWSPDGRRLAFIRQPAQRQEFMLLSGLDVPNPWSIWVADMTTGAVQKVWQSSPEPRGSLPTLAGANVLQWGADDRLVLASEEDGWLHMYALPVTGGSPTLLTPGECEVETMTLTPDRRELVVSSNCGDIDRRHLWRVPVVGGRPKALTSGDGIEWSPVVTASRRWLAYFKSDARQPAMPYVQPLDGGTARMLASDALPGDFPMADLVVPEPVVFKASDGWTLRGQLFLPPTRRPGERRPAVIFLHGGPIRQMLLGWHNREYYHRAYGLNQYLAHRGYVVLSVNFRGGIGYGRAFRMAPNRGARGASEYQDVVAAAEYLRGRPDVDPNRIGLWGGSYGGYLTALGLARNSDLFAAGADLHGVHDWSKFLTRFPGGRGGESPDPEALQLARASSPIADIDRWKSPVLLIHGDDDRNVEFSQTRDLVIELRARNIPFELRVYPDEVHDFLRHQTWVEVYEAIADFFDRHLSGGRR